MSWKEDIKEWSQKHNKDPDEQEGILLGDGWDKSKYKPSMKKDLHEYLSWWHTLSDKVKPTPATSKRRNPVLVDVEHKRITQLPSGWVVWTLDKDGAFATIASDLESFIEFGQLSLEDAHYVHDDLIDRLSIV